MMNTFNKLMGVSTMVKKATQEVKSLTKRIILNKRQKRLNKKVYKVKTKKIVHRGWYIYKKYVQLKQIRKVIN